jgi:hypothetical protein
MTTQRIKSCLRCNVTGKFGALSVFGRRIKGMITLQLEQVWMLDVECDTSQLPAAPGTNWEPWEP